MVVAKNREYHSFLVVWNGKKIVVGSHGIGGGGMSKLYRVLFEDCLFYLVFFLGASCYFEELIQAGM